jgi:hypothetical protein
MRYDGVVRALVIAVALGACSAGFEPAPDGAPFDACVADLFGEPCALGTYCRGSDVYDAKGVCIDERGDGVGVCRPFACAAVPHCTVDTPEPLAHQCPTLCGREVISEPRSIAVCVPL